jgi:hypothetical protein
LANATLTQVFDSADQLEQLSKQLLIDIWNTELVNAANATWDTRSDNKGERRRDVTLSMSIDACCVVCFMEH